MKILEWVLCQVQRPWELVLGEVVVLGDLPPCLKSGFPVCMHTLLLGQSGIIDFSKKLSRKETIILFENFITEMNNWYFKIKSPSELTGTWEIHIFLPLSESIGSMSVVPKVDLKLTRDVKSRTPLPEICFNKHSKWFLGMLKFDKHCPLPSI